MELNYTNQVFTAVDVETTGLNARYDKIIELAAVKFKDGEIIDKKSWLINPEIPIPKASKEIHGISDEMVADKPTFAVAGTSFIDFIEDSILIAHNATFDAGFIYTEMNNNNIERITNPFLDSLKMARIWYPESNKHNMKFLSEYLGFAGETYHRALDDSIYVKHLFMDGVEKNQKYKNIKYLIKKTAINQNQVLNKLKKR
jgi:DNA polymerase III epsilon subunit family exonuclease